MNRKVDTGSAEETMRVGERIGRLLQGGEVIGLEGDLGAGKTCFIRGLARGLALEPDVVYSPSFTLVAEYPGPIPLHHIDLYRLGEPVSDTEAEEIGLRDYLDPEGVTAVEWSSKLSDKEDVLSLSVEIEIGEGDRRRLRMVAHGARGAAILRAFGEAPD